MATYIQGQGIVKLGPGATGSGTAVDYSNFVSKITINYEREAIDLPATFGLPIKSQVAGAEQDTLDLEFYSDIATSTVFSELYTAFKTTSAELYFEVIYNNAAVSVDNKRYSGKCVVLTLPTPTEVGSLRTWSVSYPITSAGVTAANS